MSADSETLPDHGPDDAGELPPPEMVWMFGEAQPVADNNTSKPEENANDE